jgi:hypothetical protein
MRQSRQEDSERHLIGGTFEGHPTPSPLSSDQRVRTAGVIHLIVADATAAMDDV